MKGDLHIIPHALLCQLHFDFVIALKMLCLSKRRWFHWHLYSKDDCLDVAMVNCLFDGFLVWWYQQFLNKYYFPYCWLGIILKIQRLELRMLVPAEFQEGDCLHIFISSMPCTLAVAPSILWNCFAQISNNFLATELNGHLLDFYIIRALKHLSDTLSFL